MLYTFLFIVRFFPFWAVPLALVLFEMGVYFYNRRERLFFMMFFTLSALSVVLSILWLVFEGYWRAGPFIKELIQG